MSMLMSHVKNGSVLFPFGYFPEVNLFHSLGDFFLCCALWAWKAVKGKTFFTDWEWKALSFENRIGATHIKMKDVFPFSFFSP